MTKSNNGFVSTLYVYDVFGQLAAEYNSFGAQQSPCATCYLSYDHLGSVRMVTVNNPNADIIARHDYLPFGEEIPANTVGRRAEWGPFSDKVDQKFTGQERDQETGFDFFQVRYFYGAQGRFNSPDPGNAGADPSNPQSWNGYSYVWNNPLGYIDPSGKECLYFDNGTTGDDGQGNPCAGSQTSQTDNVNGGPPPLVNTSESNFSYSSPYSGNVDFSVISYGTPIQSAPGQQEPPKNGTPRPGPQLCAGYGTVCFPTTAPTLQPVNWKKFTMYLSCLAGTPSGLMAVASGSPQASMDSTPETQGRTTVWGYTPGKQKNGGQRPLNPSSAPEVGEAAANAPSYLNNALACSAVVANMK